MQMPISIKKMEKTMVPGRIYWYGRVCFTVRSLRFPNGF